MIEHWRTVQTLGKIKRPHYQRRDMRCGRMTGIKINHIRFGQNLGPDGGEQRPAAAEPFTDEITGAGFVKIGRPFGNGIHFGPAKDKIVGNALKIGGLIAQSDQHRERGLAGQACDDMTRRGIACAI